MIVNGPSTNDATLPLASPLVFVAVGWLKIGPEESSRNVTFFPKSGAPLWL